MCSLNGRYSILFREAATGRDLQIAERDHWILKTGDRVHIMGKLWTVCDIDKSKPNPLVLVRRG